MKQGKGRKEKRRNGATFRAGGKRDSRAKFRTRREKCTTEWRQTPGGVRVLTARRFGSVNLKLIASYRERAEGGGERRERVATLNVAALDINARFHECDVTGGGIAIILRNWLPAGRL